MRFTLSVLVLLSFSFFTLADEENNLSLRDTILAQDKAFFDAFNSCDFETWKKYLADDIEFYQDNDEVTTTRKELEPSFIGRCGKTNLSKLRRELVVETIEIHPIQGYGALQLGSHRFFLLVQNQPEKLDATPKFIHLWRHKDGAWQITRVISYSH